MSVSDILKLPGFGLPLDFMPKWHRKGEKHRFPHAIADFFATEGITLREQRMLDFINRITDKPRWEEKIKEEKIVEKWRTEACGHSSEQGWETDPDWLSPKCFDYCIQELKDKAAYSRRHGVVHVLDVDATIVKADVDDDDALFPALSRAVQPLENVKDSKKDWHPGSNGLILDLAHPSLFPLQYGKSFILPTGKVRLEDCSKSICKGVQCSVSDEVNTQTQYTRKLSWANDANLRPWGSFQWIPSDVSLKEDGSAKIDSYINNIHPQKHSELYAVLEKAVAKAVPLWNECLSWFHNRLRINLGGCDYTFFKIPGFLEGKYDEDRERIVRPDRPDGNGDDDDINDLDGSDAFHCWVRDNPDQRQIEQPNPTQDFTSFNDRIEKDSLHRFDLQQSFPDGAQVIFKLANIHLTSEKPRYAGSDWHVEGALNEHICATALFYYAQENIEDSYLEFRHEVDAQAMVRKPAQGEWQAAEDLYGIEQNGPCIQDLGKVLSRKGRILAFPNVMQHRVQPFGLADPSKPGHRKILAMFLVDPNIRILSTSNVPPQQRDWWSEEVRLLEPFSSLPIELFDNIIAYVDHFPIGWEEACEMRLELMAERGKLDDEYRDVLAEDTFFFCEH